MGVAGDRDAITLLMTVPTEKRQPNLLFASVRHLFGLSARRYWYGFAISCQGANFNQVTSRPLQMQWTLRQMTERILARLSQVSSQSTFVEKSSQISNSTPISMIFS
jgi:hypothetical protein